MSNIQRWKENQMNSLPEPFRGRTDPGWTEYSIAVRLPGIIQRVISENAFPKEIVDRLESLRVEIPFQPLRELLPDGYGDWAVWNEILTHYTGQSWFETPWLVCEFYLYRRILESIGYFNEGPFRAHDPYVFQKSEGFSAALKPIDDLLKWIGQKRESKSEGKSILGDLFHHNLEGNRVDLSLWPVAEGKNQQDQLPENARDFILADDSAEALDWIFSRKIKRIDLLMDNAGFEMLSDLCMMTFLLEQGVVDQVVLHVKPYPIFVSDVIEADFHHCIRLLKGQKKLYPALASFGEQLERFWIESKIEIMSEGFWGLPLAFWEMDTEVEQKLSKADLIISKGDANYRRLIGDLHWSPFIPFGVVVSYLPAPLLAIRVVKSEPDVGFSENKYNHMTQSDPAGMKNGKWGTFQFWNGQTD